MATTSMSLRLDLGDGAQDVAADAAKSVDGDPYRHSGSYRSSGWLVARI